MNPSVTQHTILWMKTYHDCKAEYKSDLWISVGKKQVFPCKEKKREILFITQIWGSVEAHCCLLHQLLAESLLDKMKEGNISYFIHSPVCNPFPRRESCCCKRPNFSVQLSTGGAAKHPDNKSYLLNWDVARKKKFPQILAFSLYVSSLSLFFSLSYRCLPLEIYNYPTVSPPKIQIPSRKGKEMPALICWV